MTDPLCALCGWPKQYHRQVDEVCLRKPRFVPLQTDRLATPEKTSPSR